jgi:hypothetical protein
MFTPKVNRQSAPGTPTAITDAATLLSEMKLPSSPPSTISTFSLPSPPANIINPLISPTAIAASALVSSQQGRRRNARVSITLTQHRQRDGSLLRIGFYVAKRIPGGLPVYQPYRCLCCYCVPYIILLHDRAYKRNV